MYIKVDSNNNITATATKVGKPENWILVDDFDNNDIVNLKYENNTVSIADLTAEKKKRINEVNKIVGGKRTQHLTEAFGQDFVYAEKLQEVKEFFRDSSPQAVDYPFLAAEVSITGNTVMEVATAIRSAAVTTKAAVADLEMVRTKAIKHLKNASTSEQLLGVYDIFLQEISSR